MEKVSYGKTVCEFQILQLKNLLFNSPSHEFFEIPSYINMPKSVYISGQFKSKFEI